MTPTQPATEVAAGVLTDPCGRVLLMQRLPGKHLAGLWEFPGGKLEAGETIEQALARELREELGVEMRACTPLISIPWRYPEKSVRLHAMRVTRWTGEPRAPEGHPLQWLPVRDMVVASMPAADAPIVTALRLPPAYVISANDQLPTWLLACGDPAARPGFDGQAGKSAMLEQPLTGRPAAECAALCQLRLPDVTRDVVRATAASWLARAPVLRDRLLVSHDIELAREMSIGVHLSATQLQDLGQRPLPPESWVGASCHDAAELERAAHLGVDFATLSPVRATTSHPDTTPLGWERFGQLVANARLPVYALGGVGPGDLDRARAAGAQGVAGIRSFASAW